MRFSEKLLIAAAAACLVAVIIAAVAAFSGGGESAGGLTSGKLSLVEGDPLNVAEYHFTGPHPTGQDHWHASYSIWVGDERQPNAPAWESGVTTEGDGIIHIDPFQSFEQGSGAALAKWFEYGGGILTSASFREPGVSRTYNNGDAVLRDSNPPGQVYIFESRGGDDCRSLDLTGQWIRIPPDYVPQDGDCIRVAFETEAAMRAHILSPPSLPTYSTLCATSEVFSPGCVSNPTPNVATLTPPVSLSP